MKNGWFTQRHIEYWAEADHVTFCEPYFWSIQTWQSRNRNRHILNSFWRNVLYRKSFQSVSKRGDSLFSSIQMTDHRKDLLLQRQHKKMLTVVLRLTVVFIQLFHELSGRWIYIFYSINILIALGFVCL